MKKLLTISLVLLLGCNTTGPQIAEILPEFLINEWVHSFEEDAGDIIIIYRPADYKEFPVADYRQVYKLKAAGICEYLNLHPADAHYFMIGTWTYDSETRILDIIASTGFKHSVFKIIELTEAMLKVESLTFAH